MSERKLARVVLIDSLHEIAGADRIELAIVGGWQVVVQKGLYEPMATKAVFFEVDSLLDTERPYFADAANWSSKLLHNIDGRIHARVKTMKLRKQLSQGYMIPLTETGFNGQVGDDMTKVLGVVKYEKAEEASMNNAGGMGVKTGTSALGFPKFIPKTDQTRVQNITNLYLKAVADGEEFEESFKLDGSSLTAFVHDGVAGVASRNVGFRMEDEKRSFLSTLSRFVDHVRNRGLRAAKWERVIKKDDNAFTQMATDAGLIEAIRRDGRNLAIQGEMCGPSIQKNFEGLEENTFFCYDVFLIDEQRYMLPAERIKFCTDQGVRHVPVNYTGPLPTPTVATALIRADGPSGLNGKFREGYVYKSTTRDFSFKVISNRYLILED
ncbi:putative RNA ligase [Pseudomonas phage vB_PsyM_KIL3b]|uniref:Putative RNA ligase n=5 Tax=Flaumdravirus TaxID=2560133 RepID=A0A142IF10_9CAUD|nr:RNA ligase [Pseudomonas phage vB_PsyM_KIL1]YP_009616768.1 RNA ligase [Pseudomonas phage vB_PsyM_KIL4]AMR57655.1 putative RNA ligase [Pseudomonas phage vB_PsyM_KIL3]AMR57984.1 putative RNA ligase [Pseudomonas phage vB_PsyM_KIL5]AMR58153.1 putative RNA ligase [Pseudomonas phage vB_PsyM_KIL3b]AMR57334.1 putative RNA ligase [Pseudomonas phage vB_PsyM_KIL1]AMR57815.1 putative RNA ligase [Pseudomonas phage vB_PsyM_KIL4]